MRDRSRSPIASKPLAPCEYGIRPLVEGDRSAIEAINAVTYGGHDYIASAFSGWLEREGSDLWSAGCQNADGVIVGLEILTLLDQGRTGNLDALRVHPENRGCGIAKNLQMYLISKAKDELNLPRLRYVTSTANVASRKLASSCGFYTAATWALITPGGNLAAGDTGAVGEKGQDTIKIFAQSVKAELAHFAESSYLQICSYKVSAEELVAFAKRRNISYLNQMFKAYDFTLANVQKLMGDQSFCEPIVATRKDAEHGLIESFSWAVLNSDVHGITSFITVYADSISSLLTHLLSQINAAITAGVGYVMIKYNSDLEPELLRLGLTKRMESGLDSEKSIPVANRVFLYERPFPENLK